MIDKIKSSDLKGDNEILSKKILDIFKKLNNGVVEIKIDWETEKIDRDIFDKIRENMENIGENNFFNGVNLYLEENPDFYSSKVNRKLNDIMREIQKDYVSIDNGIEEMIISDKINEVILNYYTVDYNIEELLENTKLEEIKIEINSKDKENLSLERYGDMGVYSFANDARITYKAFDNITNDVLYKNLVKDFTNFLGNDNNNKFDSLHYLLQTQGYELEDLYNKEKVENSKFLKSLQSEIQENYEGGTIVFSKIGADLEEVLSLQNSKDNIIIPKDGLCIGIHNVVDGSSSMLDIKLEKDIILNRENVKVMSDFGESEGYLVQEVNGMVDTKDGVNFKTTTEKGFEQHEIDVDKVLENAKEYFEIEMKDDEMEYE